MRLRRSLLLACAFAAALPALARASDRAEAFFSPEDDFQRALVELLLSAESTIDIAMYSMAADSHRDREDYPALLEAREITPLDALAEVGKRGVRVRIVLHNATTSEWSRRAVAPLIEAGVEVFEVAPTMHTKYAIVDGERVVSGSGNWSRGAFSRYREDWVIMPRDKRIASAYERNMQLLLSDSYRVVLDEDGQPKREEWDKPSAPASSSLRRPVGTTIVFTSDNDGTKTTLAEDLVVEQMRKAKRTIDIAMAHFDSERLADELIDAHKRGVRCRVVVDLGEYGADISQAERLERAEIPLRYHTYSIKWSYSRAQLMHHKFLLVDGRALVAGSYNWSRTAEHKNHEVIQLFRGRRWRHIVAAYRDRFDELWELGRESVPQFMERFMAEKGAEQYRRYLPCHFPTMALEGEEIARLRSFVHKLGFFHPRPKRTKKPAWEYWSYDRELRMGTDAWPEPPHKPFFDLQRLVITEVCFAPDSQRTGEFVELYNGTDAAIDLFGYVLSDGDARDTIVSFRDGATLLAPAQTALILDPDFAEDFEIPDDVVVLTVGSTTLGNGLVADDEFSLLDPEGEVVDSCGLEDVPEDAQSILRGSVNLPSIPANWRAGPASPGKVER